MHTRISLILILLLVAVPGALRAEGSLAGDWNVSSQVHGYPLSQRMRLEVTGGKLSGSLGGDKLEGTIAGHAFHAVARDEEGGTTQLTGSVTGATIAGDLVFTDGHDPKDRTATKFTARCIPARPGAPKRYEFVPTTFHRRFSWEAKPVLTIFPGDTIHTTTVDAGGIDEKGVSRVLGGNPQTGPFYVETAMPGDVLAVRIDKLRLNRDWAVSDDAIVGRALGSGLAVKMKDGGKSVRWHLDRARGVAMSESPGEHLKTYTVPVRPMLGCVGVAPGFASAPFPTGDSGRFGGNMDFNGVVEGTTVYLPVAQAGALLFIGDGHAVQGDGELNGNALETSLEVEITVDVITEKQLMTPRIESQTHIMAVGLAGSVDDALRVAVAGMSQWLEQDYQLTPSEIAQVLGTALELNINEVADRNAGVVARIPKERLAPLKRP